MPLLNGRVCLHRRLQGFLFLRYASGVPISIRLRTPAGYRLKICNSNNLFQIQSLMAKQIIFFHGGGSKEDFEADKKLVESLEAHLGQSYDIQYPFLPDEGTPDLGRRRQISQAISESGDGVILVGHSFGASMLLACLSEFEIEQRIAGVFLIATPFWQGSQDWVEAFKLRPDFAEKIGSKTPLFLYHCLDDEDVPVEQLEIYKQHLPWATFREVPTGGHQFNDDLSVVAADIIRLFQ